MGAPETAAQTGMLAIDYPESDGKPLGETGFHVTATFDLFGRLRERYADRSDVLVAADLFLYYHEGDASAVVAPDVYVVFGVPNHLRRTFKVWEEGAVPGVVIEVTSRSTRREDRAKAELYARLGIAEYFLYDPEGEYLKPPLQGFRLAGKRYRPIAPRRNGALRSQQLDLDLRIDGRWLELFETRTGERVLRGHEAAKAAALGRDTAQGQRDAAVERAERAERRAETLAAELERLRSDLERGGGEEA